MSISPVSGLQAATIIVSPTAGQGNYTTIATALTAASSGQTILIKPGTYTENITLKAGVNLAAFDADALNGNVTIAGTCSFSSAGTVDISGIRLQTNGATNLLSITGSAASIINLKNCFIDCTANTGISYTTASTSSSINIYDCIANLTTTGIAYYSMSSTGSINIYSSVLNNTGGSSTASSNSAGSVGLFNCTAAAPFSTSSTGNISFEAIILNTAAQNATGITTAGTGASNAVVLSNIATGSASAISIGSGTTMLVSNSVINSTNTNAITGAGTLSYSGISFVGTSFKINTTSQTGGLLKGGQTQAPSTGFIGESFSSANTSGTGLSTGTPANITSVSLTAGIWDVSGAIEFVPGAGCVNTVTKCSISTVSATNGTTGDNLFQGSVAVAGTRDGFAMVPQYRLTLTTTTTTYLVADSSFSGGTLTGFGRISATRVG